LFHFQLEKTWGGMKAIWGVTRGQMEQQPSIDPSSNDAENKRNSKNEEY